MHGNYFVYDNIDSSTYDLLIAGIEQSDDLQFGLSREVLQSSLNRYRNRVGQMGTRWSNVLVFNIQFVKSPCSSSSEIFFTEDEVNEINAWLTSPDYPTLFHMYDFEADSPGNQNTKYDYFGVFSDVTPQVVGGDVIGFTATFTTNSPFAWTQEIVKTTTNGSVTFTVNSAEKYREIYPIIEVTSTASQPPIRSDFTLTVSHQVGNRTDSESMQLSLRTGDTTTIDSQRSIIKDYSGLVSFTDLGISDVDYIYWPKLYNGENTVTLTGTGTATIKYREPRKVGDY